jgi:UDP-hydrolysing UDP-N-acetyl-D-glucosamine 2-epimerase
MTPKASRSEDVVRRLCILTTGRADWNLLAPVARAAPAAGLPVDLIVAAGHLDPDQGLTVRAIEAEGLPIAARIDWGQGTAATRAARVLDGMGRALADLTPDLLLLLGDRFEVLAAAQAAVLAGVPLAHLSGGDVSEGAMDDGFRHALTKLSHLHLPFHEAAARRIRQMGEPADRVHVVGNPALDGLAEAAALDEGRLVAQLAAPLGRRNLLVTFHPVTLAPDLGLAEFEALLAGLEDLGPEWTLWFTAPNGDPGGEAIAARLSSWARGRLNVRVLAALGAAFPALAARCEAVVGNSSAGLAEVPSLGVPTLDVGRRQQGRLAGPSVIRVAARPDAVQDGLARALALPAAAMVNPYGDGRSVPRILKVLQSQPASRALLHKRFMDGEAGHV